MATVTLRPSGDVTKEWNYPASGDHYDEVDEVSADDDTTYIYGEGEAAESIDLFDVPTSGIPVSSTIDSVQIFARARGSHPATPGSIKIGFNDGVGTWWEASAHALTDGVYGNYDTGALATNPRTSSAWTLTEMNALNIGVKKASGGFEIVTQIYVVITYTPPAMGGFIYMSV